MVKYVTFNHYYMSSNLIALIKLLIFWIIAITVLEVGYLDYLLIVLINN